MIGVKMMGCAKWQRDVWAGGGEYTGSLDLNGYEGDLFPLFPGSQNLYNPACVGKCAGSVPGAGSGHPGQDRNADKYDDRDQNVRDAYFCDHKSPGDAADDKCKTDEIDNQ